MVIRDWLEGEPRPTVACVSVSVVVLVLSLGRWLDGILPVDIAWVAIVLCGIPIVVGAAVGLIRDHDVTADVLVSIALIASVGTGEYFAAGEVALIMQIGTLLEDFTANRARKGIEGLIKLTPRTARIRRDGKESVVGVEDVREGDVLVVLAGETVPVDGVLLSGSTSIDQSSMTGESMPVDKVAGDELISGTVNQLGTFEMRATHTCVDSSLQRMVALAEATDAQKTRIVRIADRWAGWMVGVALLCAALTWLFTGQFMRAVTVLVVFCPCAFVLATPTAIAAAIGNLTRYGVLVRTGDAIERMAAVTGVAFDKTGTLTSGKPHVVAVEPLDAGMSREQLLSLAGSVEQRSEHPLGKAIVRCCQEEGIATGDAREVQVLPGSGIEATVDGRRVIVGRMDPRLADGTLTDVADRCSNMANRCSDVAGRYLDEGATVVTLIADGRPLGLIAIADTVKDDARKAVARLRREGIPSMLLSGDNDRAAAHIAGVVGIEEVHAGLLPQDKLDFIKQGADRGDKLCMVGDGVNDALALGAAYAGVAMGGVGSDIAVEAADAVLVGDDILRVPYLVEVSRKAMRKVKQNIIISLCINFVAIMLSAFGILDPVTGALVHNVGSVFVVVNAALILRLRDDDGADGLSGATGATLDAAADEAV